MLKNKDITKCRDCPYFAPHPEAPECEKLKEIGVKWPYTIIYPEGEYSIHPKCPFKSENSIMIYVVMNGDDIVTAFQSMPSANTFIQGTTFHIVPVQVQDMKDE